MAEKIRTPAQHLEEFLNFIDQCYADYRYAYEARISGYRILYMRLSLPLIRRRGTVWPQDSSTAGRNAGGIRIP